MAINATFNNISIISWWSWQFLIGRRNHRPAASHWQSVSHNDVSSARRSSGILTATLVVICTSSYKPNYHTSRRPLCQCRVVAYVKWADIQPLQFRIHWIFNYLFCLIKNITDFQIFLHSICTILFLNLSFLCSALLTIVGLSFLPLYCLYSNLASGVLWSNIF